MKLEEALQDLAAAGTAQNRKVYGRHGVGGPQFGVSYALLGKLAKKIERDHTLAEQLWDSGNHDARVLATLVADPAASTLRGLDQWSRDLDSYILTDSFSSFVAKTPHARRKMERWQTSKKEFVGQAAYSLLGYLAGGEPDFPDSYFEEYLAIIESQIHAHPNRVRHSMNQALICIAVRNPALEAKALKVAARIGKVEVDHGQTSCKTPDATAYIHKTLEHRRKKARSKA